MKLDEYAAKYGARFDGKVLQPGLLSDLNPDSPGFFNVAILGDTGTGDKQQRKVVRGMKRYFKKTPHALVFELGDNDYVSGMPKSYQRTIDRPHAPLIKKGVRVFPMKGNWDVLFEDGNAQMWHWGLPYRYYKVTLRKKDFSVDFYVLDTTILLPEFHWDAYAGRLKSIRAMGERQLQWLRKGLAQSRADFKIVMGHHPMYSSALEPPKKQTDVVIRGKLEDLLAEYGVDLYASGHNHHYERSKPIKGVTHMISGAGARLSPNFEKVPEHPRAAGGIARSFVSWEFNAEKRLMRYSAISVKGKKGKKLSVMDSGILRASPKGS